MDSNSKEEKLVTLAILTYTKAQILQNVLANEGIKTYIHNVHQIQPCISSGVRLRIKESDLPKALKITESSTWLSEDIVEDEPKIKEKSHTLLIPIDFSDYSLKACSFGFKLAQENGWEVVLLHIYFTPIYASSLPYGDVFNYEVEHTNDLKQSIQKVHDDLNTFSNKISERINKGELPKVKFQTVLREGVPEEEILRYAKKSRPQLIVMGTRGKHQKEIDLIGSVTAEVIDRTKINTLVIPEKSQKDLSASKNIVFLTNFNQRDLIAFESLFNSMEKFNFNVHILHVNEGNKDVWNEVKLAGIKEYFQKQYPKLSFLYNVVETNNFLTGLDKYIKEHQIDLITLTSYRRNLFTRLFNPGIAHKMLFHTETPMLIIK